MHSTHVILRTQLEIDAVQTTVVSRLGLCRHHYPYRGTHLSPRGRQPRITARRGALCISTGLKNGRPGGSRFLLAPSGKDGW